MDAIKPTQLAIAQALGIDKALVTRYKARGMPVDSVAAAQAWKLENVQARVPVRPRPDSAVAPVTVGSSAARPPAAEDAPDEGGDYQSARTRRELAEAAIAELRRGELAGELIRVEAVRSAMTHAYVTVRDAILNIPARMAAPLAAESDPAEIQNLLHVELHDALTELAAAPAKVAGSDGPAVAEGGPA